MAKSSELVKEEEVNNNNKKSNHEITKSTAKTKSENRLNWCWT